MREFRRIARRRAALLQYERDERDAFTKAYGDVVRAYATDDTEALRALALEVFAAFPERARRSQRARFDRSGSTATRCSAAPHRRRICPQPVPQAERLRGDLRALFERFERDGFVQLATVTHVLAADW